MSGHSKHQWIVSFGEDGKVEVTAKSKRMARGKASAQKGILPDKITSCERKRNPPERKNSRPWWADW